MFKETYCRMNDRVHADERLIQQTLRISRPQRKVPALCRGLALATALMLCLTVGTSALASSVPGFNSWLYTIAPDIALYFRPVNEWDEDQGLRMEVDAIRIDGRTAQIYVTMSDMTADRLDGTIDLFDSYRLDTPGSASGGCLLAHYDAEEKRATFQIYYESENEIDQDKLTFSVSRLLTKKQSTVGTLGEFDWSMARQNPETLKPGTRLRGAGYTLTEAEKEIYNAMDPAERHDVFAGSVLLAPQGVLSEPAPGVQMTGAGWIDGKLHIQMHYDDIRNTDNHGFITLLDPDGNAVDSDCSIAFWDDEKTGSYEEYTFEITQEQAEKYALYGEFITCECLITGEWSVTFPITETP